MKRLGKLVVSRNNKVTTATNGRTISQVVGQIDEATKKIFHSNPIELLSEPLDNIVEAVWGVSSDKSRLTFIQREIDYVIRPVICDITNALKSVEPVETSHSAIDFLIKKLAISQLIFMVEYLKLGLVNCDQSKSINSCSLADQEAAGHA